MAAHCFSRSGGSLARFNGGVGARARRPASARQAAPFVLIQLNEATRAALTVLEPGKFDTLRSAAAETGVHCHLYRFVPTSIVPGKSVGHGLILIRSTEGDGAMSVLRLGHDGEE